MSNFLTIMKIEYSKETIIICDTRWLPLLDLKICPLPLSTPTRVIYITIALFTHSSSLLSSLSLSLSLSFFSLARACTPREQLTNLKKGKEIATPTPMQGGHRAINGGGPVRPADGGVMRTSSTITRWQRRNWPSWPNCSQTTTV
jgi:hypothetical protein